MIDYYLLTKPKIVIGNLVTVAAGFLLASRGNINLLLFLATIVGIAFIMASSCVFNNYINRESDRKMNRTKKRALVIGLIPVRHALILATVLGIIGNIILFYFTNLLTVAVADIGFFVYVVLYSIWKGHTIYGTAIGSIAGATPPVVGYCAVSNNFDLGALIFFGIMVFWQMPHFFSIAIQHLDDYARAQIPVLPVEKGMLRTKIHITLYILGFIATSLLLTFFGYTGTTYLIAAVAAGLIWLALSLKGFSESNDRLWGRNMFLASLLAINTLCLLIFLDVSGVV